MQRTAAAAPEDRLPRSLGAWSGTALLVGLTIGSGIFRVPGGVAAEVGSVGAVALVWVLGGAVALFGALTFAELATLFPRSGGLYVFLREAYGPLPAFLYGWTELLVTRPASLGALAMIFAEYAGTFAPLGGAGVRVLAAATLVGLSAASWRSVRWGAALQDWTTAAKVLALAGLALVLFALGDPSAGALAVAPGLAPRTWGGFGVALVAVLWAYDGWADTTSMAGEVRDPARVLPRALVGGVLVVVAVYLAANAAYLYVLPLERVAASPLVASEAATAVLGGAGAAVVAALVMLSAFGALNGAVMTGPRILFAMAEDGLFFRPVAAVHPRFRTPYVAVAVTGALGVAYLSLRTFEQLAGAFVLGVWPFYALAVAGVFVLRRRRPDLPRPYRTLGYPVVPGVFLLASVALLVNSLVEQTGLTLFGLGVVAAGVPVFYAWRALSGRRGLGGTD
ncbi:MAG: amino acid permease [Longimicrobiaceae bacterium]